MGQVKHYINRSRWLRAAVLGANDGILSTTCLVIGVAAASTTRYPVVLAALAGMTAGALSMSAGEYVSVSSQADIEKADLKREKHELDSDADDELEELTSLYRQRGLDRDLAREVALKLTEHDALEAHARDELGINKNTQARPLQASVASGASFITGSLLPLFVSIFAPIKHMVICQYSFSIIFLAISGIIAARTGGSDIKKGILRIVFWGTAAMAVTAFVGYLFGVRAN